MSNSFSPASMNFQPRPQVCHPPPPPPPPPTPPVVGCSLDAVPTTVAQNDFVNLDFFFGSDADPPDSLVHIEFTGSPLPIPDTSDIPNHTSQLASWQAPETPGDYIITATGTSSLGHICIRAVTITVTE